MAGRYFGGQYDSVKQGAYLDFITKNDKFIGKLPYQVILDNYTARIRLDILLGGNVILTDAMFYDGIFFHTLFMDKEKREDFLNFTKLQTIGNIPPLLEIRQRQSTPEDTLFKMIYRKNAPSGFVFSTINQPYIKESVSLAIRKAQNSGREFSNWKEFLVASIEYADEDIVRDALNQKIQILKYLSEIPTNILRVWDGIYNFNEVLNNAKRQNRFKIERTGDQLIDNVIKTIEQEIIKPYPDRSYIQNEISRKTEIFSRPPKNLSEKALEKIWGQFLQVYNRTIGIQHYCDTFDIGEIAVDGEQIDFNSTENISQSTLQAIAGESWIDFGRKFNNLNIYRNKWLNEVWKLENSSKSSYKDARVALENFVTQLLREYNVKPTFESFVELVGGGASIDIDLMNPNGLSFGVKAKLLNIPIQVIDFARKSFCYLQDKSNLIEYGKEFMRGI